MKAFVGIVLFAAATTAQASRWVPVATGPDWDTTGLYIDRDSIKGQLPIRTVWEKFVNSYGEQQLSFVEMNCARESWRTLKLKRLSPKGSLLESRNYLNAKSKPIARDKLQTSARALVCAASRRKGSKK